MLFSILFTYLLIVGLSVSLPCFFMIITKILNPSEHQQTSTGFKLKPQLVFSLILNCFNLFL